MSFDYKPWSEVARDFYNEPPHRRAQVAHISCPCPKCTPGRL